MSHYPTPSHAVTIWLGASDTLSVAIPPLPGHDRGHTLSVPCTTEGLGWLAAMLRQRDSDKKLGQAGCPTQLGVGRRESLADILDQLLAKEKTQRKAKAAADKAERARPLTLADLGL